jgi:hypothetical protein
LASLWALHAFILFEEKIMGSRHFWVDGPAFEQAANEAERKLAIAEANYTSPKKHARLRKALVAEFGKRNYKITRTGDVHVYSPMPHSRVVGWWLMGDILTAELWLGFHKIT